jgi:CRISPR/Cas system-associated endoribonuclease Cas2
MTIFFVSYDLRKQRNYQTLYDELNRLKGIRVLESVWSLKLPDTNTCVSVRDHLKKFIDGDDGIIVSIVSSCAWSRVDNAPHKFD